MMGEKQENGIQLSQTIERSITYEMLLARSDLVQKTLEDIGNQEGIESIRIFDKKGQITASNASGEIGLFVDKKGEACGVCHDIGKPLQKLSPRNMARVFRSDKGYRLLGIINPIYNEPQCSSSACHFHPPGQNVLGVMDILVSLDSFDKQMRIGQRQLLVYFFGTFLFLSMGIGLLIFLFVNSPIQRLIVGTREIAGGNLEYRIGAYHSDEIGELGRSFDNMTSELKKSREEIRQWNVKLKKEVKRATEELKKTNQKLQELNNLKSDFMRKMEHGMRSHIGVIQSCMSLTLKDNSSEITEQQGDLIETARRRSSMLLELLDDTLLLSYRQSTSSVYHKEPLRMGDILREVVEDIQIQAQKKKITVDVDIPPGFPEVLADRKALDEVFSNLVQNAVKYTDEGGKVQISGRKNIGFASIDVKDTGIGIAREDLPRIFDEFFRAPNAKAHNIEGTGVGLAIVKEIVEAHHGRVEVHSVLEKGTTVSVFLPLPKN